MTQMRGGKGYSLWLMPRGDVSERLARTLHELSVRCAGPEFPPHVTLLGGITGQRQEVLRKSARLATHLRPFTIRLGVIDCLDEYFRCVLVRAVKTGPLLKAYQAACDGFGHRRAPAFMPHLSLVYGDLRRSLKEAIVAGLGQRMDLTFKVWSLDLYLTRGAPSAWRRVARFGLK
jgi:2'-5' RNA ligase